MSAAAYTSGEVFYCVILFYLSMTKRYTMWIQLLHPQRKEVLEEHPNLKADIRLTVSTLDLSSDPRTWKDEDYRDLIKGRLKDGLDWMNSDYFPLDPENNYSFALVLYDRKHSQPRRGEIYRNDSIEIPDKYMQEKSPTRVAEP